MAQNRTGIAGILCSLVALFFAEVHGANITIAWDPNGEADLGGYCVYYGTNTMDRVQLGKESSVTLTNLVAGVRYMIYATAYNTAGLESEPSESIVFTPELESPSGDLRIDFVEGQLSVTVSGLPSQSFLLQATGALDAPWVTVQTISPDGGTIRVPLLEHLLNPRRFYRLVSVP
jgi:hypothetical protein